MKPQWKAAIDFKWIRDNKDAVALNIKNRNSNANLELVLELYEKMLAVQKVRFYALSPFFPVYELQICLKFFFPVWLMGKFSLSRKMVSSLKFYDVCLKFCYRPY